MICIPQSHSLLNGILEVPLEVHLLVRIPVRRRLHNGFHEAGSKMMSERVVSSMIDSAKGAPNDESTTNHTSRLFQRALHLRFQ